jgi:hypothetical protein
VGLEYLEPSHDLSEGHAAIVLPGLHVMLALHEYHEAVRLSLVDDLGLEGVSSRHRDLILMFCWSTWASQGC